MVHIECDVSVNDDNNSELALIPAESLQLYDLIGSGGFGSVHVATLDDQLVAVKRTHQRSGTQDAIEESLRAELIAGTLRHENIVRVIGVCVDMLSSEYELPMLVMEYAGERNLQQVIDDKRELMPVSRRLRFASDLVQALSFAHSRGFLHLDVKPANVIVSSDDRCKLADFGCSQLCSEQESVSNEPTTPTKSSLTGTFAYRAPELLRGRCATDKADVYSTAICLWQLATRERPYRYEEHQVVIFAVVAYNMRPPLPEGLEQVEPIYSQLMIDAWHSDPERRPTAKQVLSRLAQASKQMTIDQV